MFPEKTFFLKSNFSYFRFTIFLVFILLIISFSHAQEKKWIPKDSITIKKAIRLIEKNEGYNFFFNSKIIDPKKKVLLSNQVDIDTLVFQLISGSMLRYQIREKTIILFSSAEQNTASKRENIIANKSTKIRFRIVDIYTGKPLSGAVVSNPEKNIEEISGFDGMASIDYHQRIIENIFEINYLGYLPKDTIIKANLNRNELVEISMTPEILELSEVTINGGIKKRLEEVNRQKGFINTIQVLATGTKDRLPDQNIADAIQRMSGTIITRSYGEGNAIALRGTPISYSTIQFNGETLPATEVEGVRQVNVLGFGIDQIDNVHVVKTIRAEMDGDAIGGSVDLIPTFAKSQKLSIKSEFGSGYNNLSKGHNFTGMILLSKRFFNQRFGVKLGGNIYRTDNGRDRIEIAWDNKKLPTDESLYLIDNYNLRDLENERTRIGFNFSTDYNYKTDNKVSFHFLHNKLTDKEVRNRIRYRAFRGNYNNETLVNDATVERDLRDRTKARENVSFQLGNRHFIENWRFDSSLFYSKTKRLEDAIRATFLKEDIDLVFTNINTDFPQVTGDSENIENPSLYTLGSIRPVDQSSVVGENIAIELDVKKPVDIFLGRTKLKAGIKYRQMQHKKERNVLFFQNSETSSLNFSSVSNLIGAEEFMRGNLPFNYRIDTDRLITYFNSNPNEFIENSEELLRIESEFFSKAKEQVSAFFTSAKFKNKKWNFLVGFRIEHNTGEYTGNEIQINADDRITTIAPKTVKTEYIIPLPNFQLKYNINEKSQARFAFTFGYSRPDYNAISPVRIIDIPDNEVFLGNPNLKPVRSTNIDIAYEYYLGDIGVLSASGFYKRITDFNYRTFDRVVGNEWEDANLFTGFTLESFKNGKYANLFGVELNAQTRLKFLPGFLRYLTIIGNYSITTSKAIANQEVSFKLPGQAQSFGNIVLSYDRKRFSTGLALNYNAGYTFSIGDSRDIDQLFDSRYQLDFNISQKISKNFKVYVEAINITDQPLRGFTGNTSRVSELEVYSWWLRIGAGWKF